MKIESIPAGKFKAQCLKLLDEVSDGKRMLIVTKYGKPVAKVTSIKPEKKQRNLRFGCMKGSGVIIGDIVSPMHDTWILRDWNVAE